MVVRHSFLALVVLLLSTASISIAENLPTKENEDDKVNLCEEVVKFAYIGNFIRVDHCGNGDGAVICAPSINYCCILLKVSSGQWMVMNLEETEIYGAGTGKRVIRLPDILDPETGDVIEERWLFEFEGDGVWYI
ncbi:MAG: hypothetical protein KFH87_01915 [Bacteroidetes bacterium]|nr:hypothetical protein [Bacteroidota bacterium]